MAELSDGRKQPSVTGDSGGTGKKLSIVVKPYGPKITGKGTPGKLDLGGQSNEGNSSEEPAGSSAKKSPSGRKLPATPQLMADKVGSMDDPPDSSGGTRQDATGNVNPHTGTRPKGSGGTSPGKPGYASRQLQVLPDKLQCASFAGTRSDSTSGSSEAALTAHGKQSPDLTVNQRTSDQKPPPSGEDRPNISTTSGAPAGDTPTSNTDQDAGSKTSPSTTVPTHKPPVPNQPISGTDQRTSDQKPPPPGGDQGPGPNTSTTSGAPAGDTPTSNTDLGAGSKTSPSTTLPTHKPPPPGGDQVPRPNTSTTSGAPAGDTPTSNTGQGAGSMTSPSTTLPTHKPPPPGGDQVPRPNTSTTSGAPAGDTPTSNTGQDAGSKTSTSTATPVNTLSSSADQSARPKTNTSTTVAMNKSDKQTPSSSGKGRSQGLFTGEQRKIFERENYERDNNDKGQMNEKRKRNPEEKISPEGKRQSEQENPAVKDEVTFEKLTPERQKEVKAWVKELTRSIVIGIAVTEITHKYKAEFKEKPPSDLIKKLKEWTDITIVYSSIQNNKEYVYPVLIDPASKLTIPHQDVVTGKEMTVYVHFLYTPSWFSVLREDSCIKTFEDALQNHCMSSSPVDFSIIKEGQFCAGLSEGGKWMRARVKKIKAKDEIKLKFVDYGYVRCVKAEDIRWLSSDLAQYPRQAIICRLHGVETPQNPLSYSQKAVNTFCSLVTSGRLLGTAKQIFDDGSVDMDLYLESDPRQSIGDRLVKAGFAKSTKLENKHKETKPQSAKPSEQIMAQTPASHASSDDTMADLEEALEGLEISNDQTAEESELEKEYVFVPEPGTDDNTKSDKIVNKNKQKYDEDVHAEGNSDKLSGKKREVSMSSQTCDDKDANDKDDGDETTKPTEPELEENVSEEMLEPKADKDLSEQKNHKNHEEKMLDNVTSSNPAEEGKTNNDLTTNDSVETVEGKDVTCFDGLVVGSSNGDTASMNPEGSTFPSFSKPVQDDDKFNEINPGAEATFTHTGNETDDPYPPTANGQELMKAKSVASLGAETPSMENAENISSIQNQVGEVVDNPELKGDSTMTKHVEQEQPVSEVTNATEQPHSPKPVVRLESGTKRGIKTNDSDTCRQNVGTGSDTKDKGNSQDVPTANPLEKNPAESQQTATTNIGENGYCKLEKHGELFAVTSKSNTRKKTVLKNIGQKDTVSLQGDFVVVNGEHYYSIEEGEKNFQFIPIDGTDLPMDAGGLNEESGMSMPYKPTADLSNKPAMKQVASGGKSTMQLEPSRPPDGRNQQSHQVDQQSNRQEKMNQDHRKLDKDKPKTSDEKQQTPKKTKSKLNRKILESAKCVKEMFELNFKEKFEKEFPNVKLTFQKEGHDYKIVLEYLEDNENALSNWVIEHLQPRSETLDIQSDTYENVTRICEALLRRGNSYKDLFWYISDDLQQGKVCVKLCSLKGAGHCDQMCNELRSLRLYKLPVSKHISKELVEKEAEKARFFEVTVNKKTENCSQLTLYYLKSDSDIIEKLKESIEKTVKQGEPPITKKLEFDAETQFKFVQNSKEIDVIMTQSHVECKYESRAIIITGMPEDVNNAEKKLKELVDSIYHRRTVHVQGDCDKMGPKIFTGICKQNDVEIIGLDNIKLEKSVDGKEDYRSQRHICWEYHSHHKVVSVQQKWENVKADVLVYIEENEDIPHSETGECAFGQERKYMKIILPKFKGSHQSKNEASIALFNLLKAFDEPGKNCIAVGLNIEEPSSWSLEKYFKQFLHEAGNYLKKEQCLQQKTIIFCCEDSATFKTARDIIITATPDDVRLSETYCCGPDRQLHLVVMKGALHKTKADVLTGFASIDENKDIYLGYPSQFTSQDPLQFINRKDKNVKPWSVLRSPSIGLQCKELFYVLQRYESTIFGRKDEDKIILKLQSALSECLTLAIISGYTSIGIPAIGTGWLKLDNKTVARIMTKAVKATCSINLNHFTVKFVTHDNSDLYNEISKAVEDNFALVAYQAEQLDGVRFIAMQGDLPSYRTETLIYLWDKDERNHAPKKHPILRELDDKQYQVWTDRKNKRDCFLTESGKLPCMECIHVPTSIYHIEDTVPPALVMAESNLSKDICVYFDKEHPFLKECHKLFGKLRGAVTRVSQQMSNVKRVTVLIELPNQTCERIFEKLRPPVKKICLLGAEVVGTDEAIQDLKAGVCRVAEVTILNSDAGSIHDTKFPSHASATKNTGREITEPESMDMERNMNADAPPAWCKELLETDRSFQETESVLVKGISKDKTTSELRKELSSEFKSAELIHIKGETEAVLILKEGKFNQVKSGKLPYTFEILKKQVLQKLSALIPSSQIDKVKKRTNFTSILNSFQEKGITLRENYKGLIVKATTTVGLKYALHTLVQLSSSTDYIGEFEFIETIAPIDNDIQCVFEALNKELLDGFRENKGTVSYEKEVVTLTAASSVLEMFLGRFNSKYEELKSKECVECIASDVDETDATLWHKEISDKIKECQCVYNEKSKLLYVVLDRYDNLSKVKNLLKRVQHMNNDNKNTGREKTDYNAKSGESNEADTDLRPQLKVKAQSIVFDWHRDAEHVQRYEIGGFKVHVYKASVVNLPVDCIVNAANDRLSHGGGIAYVIDKAAGQSLTEEGNRFIRRHGRIQVGEVHTTTAGNLPYRYVIHAVGPAWWDYRKTVHGINDCCKHLYNAIYNSLMEADRLGMASIALPAISSAIFGVPMEICVVQYAQATLDFCQRSGTTLKEVHYIDIKPDVVKNIQLMFDRMIKRKELVALDIDTFIKMGGSGTVPLKSSLAESVFRETIPTGYTEVYPNLSKPSLSPTPYGAKFGVGPTKRDRICLCVQDFLTVKADAVTVVIDQSGNGGRLYDQLVRKIPYKKVSNFEREVQNYLQTNNNVGNVFAVGGCETEYKLIMPIVLPYNVRYEAEAVRKGHLKAAYETVFDKGRDVDSVVIALIGIGDTETEFGAEVVLDSYLSYCSKKATCQHPKALKVILVCRDLTAYEKTKDVFSKCIDNWRDQGSAATQGSHSKEHTNKLNNAGPPEQPFFQNTFEEEVPDDPCVICMDTKTNPKKLPCGHWFCTECIDNQFKVKPACPTCFQVHGIITGDQPPGSMTVSKQRYQSCEGYRNVGTISINYIFLNGRQTSDHPNPGQFYKGISRTAYLPDNEQGRDVCRMLKVAFQRKLVFTIGSSRTTGKEGVITWNDIHHKTDARPHSQFGYPDPTYLDRVTDELKAKGVTKADIDNKGPIEGYISTQ